MTALPLLSNESLHSRANDLGARINDAHLELPSSVAVVLQRRRVRNALELLNLLHTFPSALAQDLGWRLAEVVQARDRLVAQLKGTLPDEYLYPVQRPPRATGAVVPRSRMTSPSDITT